MITRVIRASGRFWGSTVYGHVQTTEAYQLCITHEARDVPYLNVAQAIRGATLPELTELFASHAVQPAFYVDPLTPPSFVEALRNAGYEIDGRESEHWRLFDLAKTSFSAPPASQRLRWVCADQPGSAEMQAFLRIVRQTHDVDDALMTRIATNLSQRDAAVKVFPLLALYDDAPAGSLCLGIVDAMGFLSLGGTLPEFRRRGIFKWMRQVSLELARAQGCSLVLSNTAAINAASHAASDQIGFSRAFINELWVQPTAA